MKLALFTAACVGATFGLYAGSAWERFAFQEEHDAWVQRAAFCRGEQSQLNVAAAQCAAKLEAAQLSLTGDLADRLAEEKGSRRALSASRASFEAESSGLRP